MKKAARVANRRGQLTVMKWWNRSWNSGLTIPSVMTSRVPNLTIRRRTGLRAAGAW